MAGKLKQMPVLLTDEQAEHFIDTADLSEYDLSEFKPMKLEFLMKDVQVNVRLPKTLLDAVKQKAKAKGIPYTRYVRLLIENDLAA